MARKIKQSVYDSMPYLKKKKEEEEEKNQAESEGRKIKQSVLDSIYGTEDDIAPVSEDRTWFKKSEGGVIDSILGSVTDLGEHIGAGILGIGEKLVDASMAFGTSETERKIREAAQQELTYNIITGKDTEGVLAKYDKHIEGTKDAAAEFIKKDLYDEESIAKKIISDNAKKIGIDAERNSVFGEKSDALAMSAGQLGGQLVANAIVPGSGTVLMGASAFGAEAESALNEGANFNEAMFSATISAGAELLSEQLGGIKFGGKTLTDTMFNKMSSKVTSKIGKILLSTGKIGADALAEGTEELFSGYVSAVGQKLSYMEDKEIEELFSNEDKLESFIGGVVLGGAFGTVESVASGRDAASGLTKSEQSVVDKVVDDAVSEKEKGGTPLTNREKAKIRESVLERMEHGQLDIDTIESVLGGDTYKAYKDTVDSEESMKTELEELRKMKSGDMNDIQTSRMAELKEMNLDDTTKRDTLRKALDDKISPMLKGSKLTESYRERERRGQAFEADLNKYTGKQREAVERAIKSGVLNNTYRSHELVDVLSKIEADKGVVFDYTNNEKLKESGFAVEGKTVNGYANKKTGSVTLNMQSSKAWQSVVGHEITHILEGTDSYGELQNALYSYANSKGELEGRRTALTELYKDMDADIESELTADLVGDYLFTDKDFINRLTGNRNLFQKIYDEIKYLWNVATGKEKASMEKLMHEFDKAWKQFKVEEKTVKEESEEYSDSDVQYSIREEAPPKETGTAYKVFFVKDGKLYPPMVANPDGADTPMGVWLNADVGTAAPPSKTGRAQVKAGGKGTQGGSGSLAFRPGWHLGDLPRASQFDRMNPETGKKELFPENFVWAEVEYAKDVDYQEEAMSYGYTENGKFRHAYAGLPKLPENGYYRYRTNPKPDTVPWVITGAMKVNRLLSDAEVNEILEKNGVPAVHRQGGDVGLDKFGFDENGQVKYSVSEIVDENNNSYGIGVKLDSTLLDDLTPDERVEMVKERVKELGGKPFTAYDSNGNAVNVMIAEAKAKFKNKNGKIIPVNKDLTTKYIDNETKQEAVVLADELILTAKYEDSKAPMYPHGWLDNNGKNNWEYWTTYIQDKNNTIWQATLNIATTADGEKILYDVSPIKKAGRSVKSDTLPADNSIAPLPENVNTQFSVSVDSITEKYKDKTDYLFISERKNGTISIDNMVVKEKYRNQGVGTSILNDVIAYADAHGKTITLTPTSEFGTKAKLTKWYKANGFVENKGKNTDFTLSDTMYRLPRKGIQYSLSDSAGNELSKEQQEYFAESKVRDENGNLKVMYHGTPSGDFTVFRDGTYFTENKWYADLYQNPGASSINSRKTVTNPKTYEVYLDIKKPFDIADPEARAIYINDYIKGGNATGINPYLSDAEYAKISSIDWTEGEDLRDFLIEEGYDYDGLVLDEGAVGGYGDDVKYRGTSYVVFSPEQVKNVDNKNPTSDPDIRFSLSAETDANYMSAVERGDTETAQKMVDEAAKNAGYSIKAYHGTGYDFTVFDKSKQGDNYQDWGRLGKGFYFAPTDREAQTWAELSRGGKNKVMPVYLRSENMLDSFEALPDNLKDTIPADWEGLTRRLAEKYAYNYIEYMQEFGYNVQEILTEKGYDGINGHVEFVVFDPEQVKSADAVTYDDKGNVIPLSERFNTANEDIRFSLSNKGEEYAPVGNYSTPLKDLALEAPVAENVAQTAEAQTTEVLPDNFAPVTEEEADALSKARFEAITDDDMPPEMPEPYYGNTQNDPVDPFENRDMNAVGNQKVKAYMYENPEVKPFFQQEAEVMLGDLYRTQKGERIIDADMLYETGGESGAWGISRQTAPDIAELKDEWGYTYAEIEKGLKAIIEDNGKENNACSKRIEFMLNDRLMNGYQDFIDGIEIPGNQEYINLVNEKGITEYNEESFKRIFDNIDRYAPPVDEDIAPVLENIPVKPDSELESGTYEAITPKPEKSDSGAASSRKQLHKAIINGVKTVFEGNGFNFDEVLKKAKNLSTFATVDNTPQRVMEKALGYKEGQALADLTVNKVAQNETAGIKWLNSFTDRKNGLLAQISKQYRIKPGSKESAAAQMYAEGFYVNDNNDIIAYGDAELAQDFPNLGVQNRIKGLAHDPRIRQIYDDTLNAINESRTRNAYPEIPRLENYFLHFRAMDDTFSRLGLPFNPNDIRAKDLPTDLNGVTADLKPGQPYFASAMHRMGKRTSFDLLGGLERYLTSAKNQIYHIDDIQTLRALRNYIADEYGQANGLEGIDALTEEEAQERIEQVFGSHLSTFAKFLNEEANVLAGKTALIDRGLEGIIGRRGMTFLDTVNRQVGSNMVGFNISSSLTNFLPVAQTFAKTNKFDFTKAFAQTVSNKISSVFGKSDGFTENSPVVIRRKGADRFYRTPFQKAGDAGYVFMSAVDDISTELIARTKFNEFTRKGMDEQTAHFETDKWVSRLMGDRSLGQQPQLYNSKTLGVLTKFQLEVRNQLDSQFYDTIQEAKVSSEDIQNALARNAKIAAKVTSTFVQLAVVQHLYGKAFESVAGYNPAFDIIETLATMFGWDDEEDSEDTVLDNIEEGFLALLEDLPYTSTFTGGRIPIASALPITEMIKGVDQYGNEKSRLETIKEAAPYYILPGGYGQLKKTRQGLNMFSDEHPVSGSYTDSGKLRFPVEDTPLNRAQAAIFGQYASQNAREYFDNDYAPLDEKQIQEYIDVDIPIRDYREYREGLKGLGKVEEKFDYISGLDLPVSKKNILINNVVDRKDKVDLTGYEDFADYDEFDFATKNPEKWDFLQSNNISYAEYNASDDSREAYNWAANNPESYMLSKAVSDDVVTYRQYTSELYDIKADKDANGKSISGSRKAKVIDYINNLDADYYTKIILYKSEYQSDDTYNRDIIEYINSRDDFTYEEKVTILTKLGFRVEADGQIYAD